jgi:hypothetical protein
MKKSILILSLLIMSGVAFAGKLVLIGLNQPADLQALHLDKNISIHYQGGSFVVATVADAAAGKYTVLDEEAWAGGCGYFVVSFYKGIDKNYLAYVSGIAGILKTGDDYLILKVLAGKEVTAPTQGSIVRIHQEICRLPQQDILKTGGAPEGIQPQKGIDPNILTMMANVDTNIFLTNLQHLQDYGTRNCYTPQAVQAQNWIKSQFESYGYSTQLFDFTMPSGSASDNVLATKTGTKYPDEYVLLGAHYDSYVFGGGNAPGADDNATGTCGVLEAARVMAGYDFDRTIIFCAWSGEEYGLYGSEAYASWAESQNMNILGYFNIDMCGYRYPGDPIHTDIIAPASATPLKEFYKTVCALYLPTFQTFDGALSGGDSDHTSFNDHGYMGIFPFEDSQNYSPYIHTANDLIGPSVNSLAMCRIFTQAMVANVTSMANYLAPPANFKAIPKFASIKLSWDPVANPDHYNVYRDNVLIGSTTETSLEDFNVTLYTTYQYFVTVVYTGSPDESNPSNTATVTLLPPMAIPFTDLFEAGTTYWTLEGTWGLTTSTSYSPTHSLTESPSGNYGNNLNISANLYPFTLAGVTQASISFYTKYNLESGYDYTYLEVSTNGSTWSTLATFNGNQSTTWSLKTYSLNAYLGQPLVLLRFRFYSDSYITKDGMYIDNFTLQRQTSLDLQAYLEGPFGGTTMTTALNSGGFLPLSQPYQGAPWNYNGTESVASIPNAGVVDWVLVELRDAANAAAAGGSTTLARQACFLLNNGKIVGLNGSSYLQFSVNVFDQLYAVVWHRNHLGIISANPMTLVTDHLVYNYSSGVNQVFGGPNGHKQLASGIWGMISGDGNADRQISNADKNDVWAPQSGFSGYRAGDFDLNGQVDNIDKVEKWKPNSGLGCQVPN